MNLFRFTEIFFKNSKIYIIISMISNELVLVSQNEGSGNGKLV